MDHFQEDTGQGQVQGVRGPGIPQGLKPRQGDPTEWSQHTTQVIQPGQDLLQVQHSLPEPSSRNFLRPQDPLRWQQPSPAPPARIYPSPQGFVPEQLSEQTRLQWQYDQPTPEHRSDKFDASSHDRSSQTQASDSSHPLSSARQNQFSNGMRIESESSYPELPTDISQPQALPWMTHHQKIPLNAFPVRHQNEKHHESTLGGAMYPAGLVPSYGCPDRTVEDPWPSVEQDELSGNNDSQEGSVMAWGSSQYSGSDNSSLNGEDDDDKGDEVSSEDEADVQDKTPGLENNSNPVLRDWSAASKMGQTSNFRKKRTTGFRGRGGWNKGTKMGTRPVEEPSQEFMSVQNEAMKAFIEEQDLEQALRLIQQAIAINPEVYSAHALLSEIYLAMGEDQNSVDALFKGAHAAPRVKDVWRAVSDRCLRLTTIDRTQALEYALHCQTRLLAIDKADYDAHFQRASINRELKNFGKAIREFGQILDELPQNPSVIRQIAGIFLELGHADRAQAICEGCIKHYREVGEEVEDGFSWPDVICYVEIFAHQSRYDESIAKLKKLARWLVGRDEEVYWDNIVEDDREWDAEDDPRRTQVAAFKPGMFPVELYGDALPLDLRVKLGSYRLKQGLEFHDEALGHFEWLDPDNTEPGAYVFKYQDLFLEAANALKTAKEHSEALRYYEALKIINAYSDSSFYLNLAATSYICGKRDRALEYYEMARAIDANCIESRSQLAKLYLDNGEKAKALQAAEEAVMIGRQATKKTEGVRRYERKEARLKRTAAERIYKEARRMAGLHMSRRQRNHRKMADIEAQLQSYMEGQQQPLAQTPNEKYIDQRRATTQKVRKMNDEQRTENVQNLYSSLVELSPAMRGGDQTACRAWLECAQELIADFCNTRVLFPPERHMIFQGYDREAKREAFQKSWQKDLDAPLPDSSIPNEYRGVLFSSWLDLFLETALLHAIAGDSHREACYGVIKAAIDCSVWYHDPEAMIQIYTCYFACALELRDEHTLYKVVGRWFMRQYRFCTDAYRLFAACNLLYTYPNGGKQGPKSAEWRDAATQKFMFRHVTALDSLLPEDYNIEGDEGPVPQFMRKEFQNLGKDDDEEEAGTTGQGLSDESVRPEEMDVVLLSLYAQILYAGNSFPNAMSYLYRALTIDPKNPMVLLSLALSYIHQLTKRQVDDRHMHLLNGMAAFEEYADARLLQASKKGQKAEDTARQEVAFNRARIWQMMGLTDLALKGYDKVMEMYQHKDLDGAESDGINEEWSMEAAFATATIYASNGDPDMARCVTEKWLVVE